MSLDQSSFKASSLEVSHGLLDFFCVFFSIHSFQVLSFQKFRPGTLKLPPSQVVIIADNNECLC